MEQFFKELLLEEGAIYTLWGSKPVTRCVLYYYTEEEIEEYYNQMTEEEKKEAIIREDPLFEENWEKWASIQNRFPMTRYLLFKRNNYGDKENKTALLYFVNILETALAMQRHYAMFKAVVGEDFNPFDMACEFNNIDSPFWKKVNDHAALIGILFGFGERNSWSFYWKYFGHQEKYERVAEAIPSQVSDPQHQYGQSSLADFSLPVFMIVGDGKDEMVEKYRKEREEIKKIYKGQDFIELTLHKMMSQ